jgi:hypothetical protein
MPKSQSRERSTERIEALPGDEGARGVHEQPVAYRADHEETWEWDGTAWRRAD